MKKSNHSKIYAKKSNEIDELKKPVKLKPNNKKINKNWKNNLFKDEDDDIMFDDLNFSFYDDFDDDIEDDDYEEEEDDDQ